MPDLLTSGEGSISVTMSDKETDKPIPGGKLELIKIASVEVNDGYYFAPTEEFKTEDFKFDLSEKADLSDPSLAANINTYVDNHSESVKDRTQAQIGTSGADTGKVTFTGLALGLYLVRETEAAEGYAKIRPFLVTIPQKTENGYVYQVDATPKAGKASRIANAVVHPKLRKTVTIGDNGYHEDEETEDTEEGKTEKEEPKAPADEVYQFRFERLDGKAPAVSNKSGAVTQGGDVVSQDADSIVLQLTGEGELAIGTITFEEAGEYFYQLSEIKGKNSLFTYDDTVFWIKYVVGLNAAEDSLEIKQTEVRLGGSTGEVYTVTDAFPFENEYIPPTPTPYLPEGYYYDKTPTPSPSPTPPGDNYVPTSTPVPDDGGRLPQTGQLWWPIWVLCCCGAVLIIAGVVVTRRSSKKGNKDQ